MIKITCIVLFMAAVASAGVLHTAPLVAAPAAVAAIPAPIVTARSSQVVARNYNTLAAAPLAYSSILPASVHAAAVPVAAPLTLAAAPAAHLPYAAYAYASPL